jgi:hypothetical protein
MPVIERRLRLYTRRRAEVAPKEHQAAADPFSD